MRLHYADYWDIHHRRSIRLPDRDYAGPGMYFVTVCTAGRERLLGQIVDGKMHLNEFGKIVWDCWLALPRHFPFISLDAFVVMPNHIHGIINIHRSRNHPDTKRGCWGKACLAPTRRMKFQKPPARSLCSVIGSFKSATTKRVNIIRDSPGARFWQRNYHERVIRDGALHDIRRYITENPKR